MPGAPRRPSIEQLRAGQRDDVDRATARPGQHLLDEVQEAVIGPLEVLEDHHYRARLGDPLEEGPPREEELAALPPPHLADAEQLQERLLQAERLVCFG